MLTELHSLCGKPSQRELSRCASGLSARSVGNILNGKGEPRTVTIVGFILACLEHAGRNPRSSGLTEEQHTGEYWRQRYDEAMGPVAADGRLVSPYPGLAPFGADNARWFFGRTKLVEHIVDRLDRRLTWGGLQVVMAPSGAGKTSLLQAGLIPRLAGGKLPGSADWPVLALTPTSDPLLALTTALSAHWRSSSAAVGGEDGPPVPSSGGAADSADIGEWVEVARSLLPATPGAARILVIVDQAEELFTACADTAQRAAFLDLLAALASPRNDRPPVAVVIVGIRADFYADCVRYPVLEAALQDDHVVVGPLSADELREVIVNPAQDVSLSVAPALVELILHTVGAMNEDDSGAQWYAAEQLPWLAHVLRACWERREGSELTVKGYHDSGGIRGAIQNTAETSYRTLDEAGRKAAEKIFRLLVRFSDDSDHTDDTRRRRTRDELMRAGPPVVVNEVLQTFTDARLLTAYNEMATSAGGGHGRDDTVEITHEALLRAWHRLRTWIRADRADNLFFQQLNDDAVAWQQTGRDLALVYRGSRLQSARAWAQRTAPTGIDKTVGAFLAASARHYRRGRALRIGFVVALVVSTITTGLFAVTAQKNADNADRQHVLALSRQLAAQGRTVNTQDAVAARQLAMAALSAAPTGEADAALGELLGQQQTDLIGHRGSVLSMMFNRDSSVLATGGQDGSIRLWDTASHQPAGAPLRTASAVKHVVYSPDDTMIATSGEDGSVQLWNAATHQAVGAPVIGRDRVEHDIAFSADSALLAIGAIGDDYSVQLWGTAERRWLSEPFGDPFSPVNSVAFSPDGRTLATGSSNGNVQLWDVPTRSHLGAPLVEDELLRTVVFSPDGTSLATVTGGIGGGSWVRLWDTATRKPRGTSLVDHTEDVTSVAFSRDSKKFAVGSRAVAFDNFGFGYKDGVVRLWSTDTGQAIGTPLTSRHGFGASIAFGSDSSTLAVSGGDDGTVQLWDTENHHPRSAALDHAGAVHDVAVSPDGRILAVAYNPGRAGKVQFWDLATRRAIGDPLVNPTGGPMSHLTFSSDGSMLATTGGFDQTVVLWSTADHRSRGTIKLADGQVLAMAFDTRGALLATASSAADSFGDPTKNDADGAVQLWDVATQQKVGPPIVQSRPPLSIAFDRTGSVLATGDDVGAVHLWSTATRQALGSPLGDHSGVVLNLAFSPDGGTLATGTTGLPVGFSEFLEFPADDVRFSLVGSAGAEDSGESKVQLWDTVSHLTRGPPLVDHARIVLGLAFSHDGAILATSTEGVSRVTTGISHSAVRLWDTATGRPLGIPLVGHTDAVRSLVFTSHGNSLVTGSADGTARVWDAELYRDPLRKLCTVFGNVDSDTWQTYVPDEPLPRVCP